MGEAAEDLINGFACQQCGEMIDGDEPGYARSCSVCEAQSSETNYEQFKSELIKAGYQIESQKEIVYGMQFRLKGGHIVNKYYTGRFAVQGKPNQSLKDLMYKLL